MPIVIGRGECRNDISFCLRDNISVHYNFLAGQWKEQYYIKLMGKWDVK